MANLIGQSLGRYKILELQSEDGMVTLYKAFDTLLQSNVSITAIQVDQFTPAILDHILKRFELEVKTLVKMNHPNIAQIIDYGNQNGVLYLVMMKLYRGTLKQRLEKRMNYVEAAQMLAPVARTLEYAHGRGIIHRDVKPSNIMITESDKPILTGFGIANIFENEGSHTMTMTGVGVVTPEYMAPEQWDGIVTPQTDIYSLGVVFYEMVTGRKPYAAETPAEVLQKQVNEPLPRPSQYVPDLPEQMEGNLLKALAKKPEDRYLTMGQFATVLEGTFVDQKPEKTENNFSGYSKAFIYYRRDFDARSLHLPGFSGKAELTQAGSVVEKAEIVGFMLMAGCDKDRILLSPPDYGVGFIK